MTSQHTAQIDETDKKILQLLQDEFPIIEEPYKAIGEKLDLTETQIINRLKHLNQTGITQKIGAVVDRSKIGFSVATLIALKVPAERVTAVSQVINQYGVVSHNYLRENEYNVWFTLSAQTRSEMEVTLKEILQKADIADQNMLNLPTKNCYKINVRFQIT